ncbi:hypothetical protein KAW65_03000 [candidate division WOR-3 bacterium]|nr:hypothetical protein [candidate division WOR-3 bacterium]
MKKFPLLEILIGVSICLLIWLLGYPQYKESASISKRYQARVNMYTLRAAIENYAAYNEGKFPVELKDFETFLTCPLNPYTGKPVEKGNIQIFQYDSKEEPKEQSPDSKNGRLHGGPGAMAYGYFIAPGDTLPIAYGVIGFDKSGKPLSEKTPSGKIKLFVLNE